MMPLCTCSLRITGGEYQVPFPVAFRDDRWFNAHTGEELDIYVAAWRPQE